MTSNTTIILIVIALAITLIAIIHLARRKPAARRPKTGEGTGVGDDGDDDAAIVEDVAGRFSGVDGRHGPLLVPSGGPSYPTTIALQPEEPAFDDQPDLPPDDLTRLKGLGPKAAGILNDLGIRRYAQLAALDSAGVARVDAALGAFKGRITRDRWIEQARLLAAGDIAGFEAQFGKLG